MKRYSNDILKKSTSYYKRNTKKKSLSTDRYMVKIMRRPQTTEIQTTSKPIDNDLNQRLFNISQSLKEILEELRSRHNHKLSIKTEKEIEQSLKELREGKGIRYKNITALDKSLD